jgi:hypothetical protein
MLGVKWTPWKPGTTENLMIPSQLKAARDGKREDDRAGRGVMKGRKKRKGRRGRKEEKKREIRWVGTRIGRNTSTGGRCDLLGTKREGATPTGRNRPAHSHCLSINWKRHSFCTGTIENP